MIPEDQKIEILQRMFEVTNLQKQSSENIIYYIWHTPADKIDNEYLSKKKRELNIEVERWDAYFAEVCKTLNNIGNSL